MSPWTNPAAFSDVCWVSDAAKSRRRKWPQAAFGGHSRSRAPNARRGLRLDVSWLKTADASCPELPNISRGSKLTAACTNAADTSRSEIQRMPRVKDRCGLMQLVPWSKAPQCFIGILSPPSAVTGACTSCVNCFLVWVSSNTSVIGTMSPPLSCCLSSISMM